MEDFTTDHRSRQDGPASAAKFKCMPRKTSGQHEHLPIQEGSFVSPPPGTSCRRLKYTGQ
eukprot:4789220-Amphidinium_carterae.1